MSQLVVPSKRIEIFDGYVEVLLFGPGLSETPLCWRTLDPDARSRMALFSSLNGIERLLVPVASEFNGLVQDPEDLPERVNLQGGISTVELWTGIHADGLSDVPEGSAYWLASGDCPTFILTDGGRVVPSHAGLRSLVDRRDGVWCREQRRPSVVDNAVASLNGHIPTGLQAFVSCGTSELIYPTDHPEFGESNSRLREVILERWGESCFVGNPREGRISLRRIIERQLEGHGVPQENIDWDGICTNTDTNGRGRFSWWSCARGDDGRNGVLVRRIRREV